MTGAQLDDEPWGIAQFRGCELDIVFEIEDHTCDSRRSLRDANLLQPGIVHRKGNQPALAEPDYCTLQIEQKPVGIGYPVLPVVELRCRFDGDACRVTKSPEPDPGDCVCRRLSAG